MVALESIGLPLPGEATLVAAAIVAGTGRELDIRLVIAVAAIGAILGDNIGFWIGRELGYASPEPTSSDGGACHHLFARKSSVWMMRKASCRRCWRKSHDLARGVFA